MSKNFKLQILCNDLFPYKDKSVNRYVNLEIFGGKNIPEDLKEFSAILQTIFKQFNDENHNNTMFSKNPKKEKANIGKDSLSCYCNNNFGYRLTPDNETFYDVKQSKQYSKLLYHIKSEILDRTNLTYFPMDKVAEEFITFEPHFKNVFVEMKHKELLVSFFYQNRATLNKFLDSSLHHNFIYKHDTKKLIKTLNYQNAEIRDYFSTHPNIEQFVNEICNFSSNNKLKL